jgi:hypothetical protein
MPIRDRFLCEDERAVTVLKTLRKRFLLNQKEYGQSKGVLKIDGPVFGYVDGFFRK